MATPNSHPRFKRRVCRQCGNELIRISPDKPAVDEVTWNAVNAEGRFFCEKCHLHLKFPLVTDEPRDIELAPRVQA